MADRSLSRRNLFRRFVPEATEHVARQLHGKLRSRPRRRPPGAIDEAQFLERCTRCDECVDACPHHAVFTLTAAAGIGAGTPVMVPERRPCSLCDGFPCARACPEGALVVPENALWKLGTVQIAEARCLPFMGPECGACAGLCPPGAPALALRLGRPAIDREACVGCGLCIEACPTDPPAIEMLPLE